MSKAMVDRFDIYMNNDKYVEDERFCVGAQIGSIKFLNWDGLATKAVSLLYNRVN